MACHLPVGGECSAISHTAQPEVSSGRVCGIIAWTRHGASKKSFIYRERKCWKSVCFLNLNVKTFLLFVSCLSFFFFPLARHPSGKQGRDTQKVITTRPAWYRLRQLLIKQPWSKSNHSKHMAHEYRQLAGRGGNCVIRQQRLVGK